MGRRALEAGEVARELAGLPAWAGDTQALRRTYVFRTFAEAIQFMSACVAGIDARDHHPAWTNEYNKVTAVLSTHDAGHRVTEKDVDLAKFLDQQAAAFPPG